MALKADKSDVDGKADISYVNAMLNPIGGIQRRRIKRSGSAVSLYWADPDDILVGCGYRDNGTVKVSWESTTIVKKEGSVPTSVTDGTVVVVSDVKNQYEKTPFVDTQSDSENWYYRAFPKSTAGAYCTETFRNVFEENVVYGFVIDETNSDENTSVSYMSDCDNADFERSYMDFTNDTWVWGGWESAFFLPRPCMLKYGGDVDYYLSVNDNTKREDGVTASDVANINYGGNAMMEFPKVFYKATKVDGRIHVWVSNEKWDDGFECWSCLKADGTYSDHFYMPIYEGYKDSSNRLRSMCPANTKRTYSTTATQEKTYANANGEGWSTTLWADEELVRVLGVLMCRRLNFQLAVSNNIWSSQTSPKINLGAGNTKGMFYGVKTTDASVASKFFGMENWWCHIWRRCQGLNCVNRVVYVKMTKHRLDGSNCDDFITSDESADYVNRYINTGVTVCSGSSSWITKMNGYTKNGLAAQRFSAVFLPIAIGGSETTYYSDGMWSSDGVRGCILGGSVNNGSIGGLFAICVDRAPSHTVTYLGASLSYRPY